MRKILHYLVIFLIGFIAYPMLEILWRGYTHWTMAITGGAVFLFLYSLFTRRKMAIWKKCLIGASIVTVIEFIVGVIVNLGLGWNVWDYSGLPGNILGQVCPTFFLLWIGLCLPADFLCRFIYRMLQE